MSTAGKHRLRYAVVGAGHIAQHAVIPAFTHARENSELVALVSGKPEKQSALSKLYDIPHTGSYAELEQVLARSGADAIYLATPNDTHRELTERAAKVGVHILCEKPMAPSVRDCEAMLEACRTNGVKLMVAYRLHFEEATLRAIDWVQRGVLGTPKLFSSLFSQQVRPGDIRTQRKSAGGALLDMGVYPINTVRNLFRAEPIEVTASMPQSFDPRFAEVDEIASVLLRFPEGQVAQLTVCMGASALSTYSVLGTRGELHVSPAFGYESEVKIQLSVDGQSEQHRFPARDQFAPELIYFSRCVLTDTEPEPSGEEGLLDLRVCQAAFESAKTGQRVHLAPYQRGVRPDLTLEIHKPPARSKALVHASAPTLR